MKRFNPAAGFSSKRKFEDSDEEEDFLSEQETEYEQELTIEELLNRHADGTLPLNGKAKLEKKPSPPNKNRSEEPSYKRQDGTLQFHGKDKLEKKPSRANRNRPMEMSSKGPVRRYREVIQVPKAVVRDPRFDSLSGKFDEEGFKKRYDFLFKETLPTERAELQKQLKSSSDPEVIAELKSRISWIDKQLKWASPSSKQTEAKILAEHKKKQRVATKEGKRPFYLKKSEVRKQRLIEKYHSLKEAGKVDEYIEKRRKRNAAKDHRFIPYRRQS